MSTNCRALVVRAAPSDGSPRSTGSTRNEIEHDVDELSCSRRPRCALRWVPEVEKIDEKDIEHDIDELSCFRRPRCALRRVPGVDRIDEK